MTGKPTLLTLIFMMFYLASCSVGRQVKSTDTPQYRIRPGDVVQVKFDHYPDFDQTVFVQPDGIVSFSAIGKIDVINLSASELRTVLSARYGQMLSVPILQVDVHNSAKFTVYIGGDIKKPGVVKFQSNLSLVQGILLAGGLRAKSDQYEIFVFRSRGNAGMKTFKFYLGESKEKRLNRNFQLAPYDVIFVLRTTETEGVKDEITI